MSVRLEHLKQALANVQCAENTAREALRSGYPVGSTVGWDDNKRHGDVLGHGYDARIKVRNASTGREYWLHAYRISS